ncbi:MAG: hypothetical protein JKP97_09505 [Rhodobacteraceae bacterium]|jgi:selenocysteine lyase/cysteine desulfurase|nr:hypothetical protein [Paracoccaceae bacterium]
MLSSFRASLFATASGWSRSVYSISLSERLGLEGPDFETTTDGFIRIGISHYNTIEEIDTLLGVLDDFAAQRKDAPRRVALAHG